MMRMAKWTWYHFLHSSDQRSIVLCLFSHARDQWFPTYKLRICEIWKKISRQNHFSIRTLIFPSVKVYPRACTITNAIYFVKNTLVWAKDHHSCVSAPSETTHLAWHLIYHPSQTGGDRQYRDNALSFAAAHFSSQYFSLSEQIIIDLFHVQSISEDY
jgi:hypothetical protein